MSDDMLRAIAANGGVVMVNFFPGFIDPQYGTRKTPLSMLVDHIAHIVDVAGPDHVGLGSDYDGVPSMPVGLEGVDGLPSVTLELLRRGYSDEVVRKILGENFLRVMAAGEACSSIHAAAGGRPPNQTLSGDGSMRKIEGG